MLWVLMWLLYTQGIVPTPAEELVVMELTESQFAQLTPADDVVIDDPEPPTGMFYRWGGSEAL